MRIERVTIPRCLAMLLLASSLGGVLGCGNRPPRVDAPDWSPHEMAQAAVAQLDSSGDGQIDRQEAVEAPGLLDAFELLDADHSGGLSNSEIEARFELYEKLKTAFVKTTLQIKLNRRPLPGTFVKLVPEEFQGDSLRPATGVTNEIGQVSPRAEGQDLPAMQPGFYRVELYKDEAATQSIPVKTQLGVESSPQSRPGRNLLVVLDFEAKK